MDLQWKRASELFDNVQLFDEDIDPTDIVQGAFGNCYFCATLAAVAERSERIQALFADKKANLAGCYLINFYVNGVKTAIMVDDWLPAHNGALLYGRSKAKGEIWVSLIEKAWAKLHGTYQRCYAGWPVHVCDTLLGVYSRERANKDHSEQEWW